MCRTRATEGEESGEILSCLVINTSECKYSQNNEGGEFADGSQPQRVPESQDEQAL